MKVNIVTIATQHNKTSAGAVAALTGITSVDVWVLKILPEFLSVAALLFSIILSVILIRYHLINTKTLKLENQKKQLEIEKLKNELSDDVKNIREVKKAS